jgi:pyruvate formate lyase activating enzyme
VEIKGLIETSFVDWPGRVCAVIFLGGCNFRCPYCHNHELVLRPRELSGRRPEQVLAQLAPYGDWLDGVVVSGGEPCLEPELPRLCRALKKLDLPVKIDTNGSKPRVLEELMAGKLIEAVSMDLKAPLTEPLLHRQMAGVAADLTALERSMDLLLAAGLEREFRTTVVPGYLTEEHLTLMARRVKGADRYKINPFRPLTCLDQAFTKLPGLSDEDLKKFQALVDSLI